MISLLVSFENMNSSTIGVNKWGQININFQSKWVKGEGANNNWGQININFCDSKRSVDREN
jgi:hypothetical protein